MSNDKPRNMTVKGFLHKAGGKAANSAIAFIAAHRQWLQTGELAEVTSPILRLVDEHQLMPTPALELLKDAVLTHHLRVETTKAEKRLAEQAAGESGGASAQTKRPWIARVFDSRGNLVVVKDSKGEDKELEETFQMASDADRWCDRKLVDGAPDWFAVVQHTTLTRSSDGEPITSVVLRGDAMARLLKVKKGPVSKKTSGSAQKLSFGVKLRESRAVFSGG